MARVRTLLFFVMESARVVSNCVIWCVVWGVGESANFEVVFVRAPYPMAEEFFVMVIPFFAVPCVRESSDCSRELFVCASV